MTPQRKATIISSTVAALLTLMKLVVGIASGSVAVLASAVDSILDMFVSLFNYFAILNSEKPADKTFNYGRGKIEALALVIEGTIITLSGLYLLYEAVKKALTGGESQYLGISIYVMIASLVITVCLVMYLNYVAKKTRSMVIEADALHYKTDVLSNIAVLLSLAVVGYTGVELVDVLIGAGIAFYIIYSAFELIKKGVLVLLDRALDDELVLEIEKVIVATDRVNGFHLLKTREAAHQTFVDVHVVFDHLITLVEAHKVSHKIEAKIKRLDQGRSWIINIHMDPYDDYWVNDMPKKNRPTE